MWISAVGKELGAELEGDAVTRSSVLVPLVRSRSQELREGKRYVPDLLEEPDTDAEPDPEPEPEADADWDPEAVAEPASDPDPEAEADAEAELDPLLLPPPPEPLPPCGSARVGSATLSASSTNRRNGVSDTRIVLTSVVTEREGWVGGLAGYLLVGKEGFERTTNRSTHPRAHEL